jgi:hypothetical protein
MKKIYILLFLLFQGVAYSQKTEHERISVVSPSKDTLWLINNSTGHLIAHSWEEYQDTPEQKKPVILLVDVLPVDRYCYVNSNKKNGKRKRGKK